MNRKSNEILRKNEKRKSNSIEPNNTNQTVSAESYSGEHTHLWNWGKECNNRNLERQKNKVRKKNE